jgi:hypothetical protein
MFTVAEVEFVASAQTTSLISRLMALQFCLFAWSNILIIFLAGSRCNSAGKREKKSCITYSF